MSLLFTPVKIGALELPNRLVRSATAERLADPDGPGEGISCDLYPPTI